MLTYLDLIICYSYGIPSLILYCRIVWVLITNKSTFKATFYKIVLMSAISDIVLYTSTNYTMRLPRVQFMIDLYYSSKFATTPSYYHVPANFLLFFCTFQQNCGSFLLSLNRLTSMIYYLSYERYWKNYFFLAIFFFIFIPLLPSFKFLFCKAYFNQIGDEYSTNYEDSLPWLDSFSTMPVMSATFTITCFLLNLSTLIVLGLHKAKHPPSTQQKDIRGVKKIDLNMLLISLCIFFGHLCLAAYNIVVLVLKKSGQEDYLPLVYHFYLYISDFANLSSAWLLFFFSSSIHRAVLGKFCCQSKTSTLESITLGVGPAKPAALGPAALYRCS